MPLQISMHDALESIMNLRAWLVFVLLISILDNLKLAKGDSTEHARRRLVDQTPGTLLTMKSLSVLQLSLSLSLSLSPLTFPHGLTFHAYFNIKIKLMPQLLQKQMLLIISHSM